MAKGVRARLDLNKMSDNEQHGLVRKHDGRIKALTEECIKVLLIKKNPNII